MTCIVHFHLLSLHSGNKKGYNRTVLRLWSETKYDYRHVFMSDPQLSDFCKNGLCIAYHNQYEIIIA